MTKNLRKKAQVNRSTPLKQRATISEDEVLKYHNVRVISCSEPPHNADGNKQEKRETYRHLKRIPCHSGRHFNSEGTAKKIRVQFLRNKENWGRTYQLEVVSNIETTLVFLYMCLIEPLLDRWRRTTGSRANERTKLGMGRFTGLTTASAAISSISSDEYPRFSTSYRPMSPLGRSGFELQALRSVVEEE